MSMSAGISGQVVFITGASSGLGRELALQIAAKGGKLGLFARRQELLASLVEDVQTRVPGAVAHYYVCDVADRASVLDAMARASVELGAADLLIANAGIGYPIKAKRFDSARAAAIYQVNVFGMLHAIEAVLPAMLQRGRGHIVGISSLASYRSYPESHAYCASKSAVSAQLEGLRMELAPQGVAVTTICPGFIKTEMTAGNTIKMPFLMECSAAVARIIGAIERKERVYSFPKRLLWIIKASRLIPEALLTRVVRPPRGKSYKE